MAKYNIKHTCGHTETHQITGQMNTREHRADWLSEQDCSECRRAAKQAEYAAQSEIDAARTADLPALNGTPKQIAWATTIRATALDLLTQGAEIPEKAKPGYSIFFGETSAKWWIDNRSDDRGIWIGKFERVMIAAIAAGKIDDPRKS